MGTMITGEARCASTLAVLCRCLRAWAAVAPLLVMGTCAYAESTLDAIRARGVLRVGVKMDAAPFGSLDAAGRPIGFEIELARLFARVLLDDDARVKFVPVTTATRFGILQAGGGELLGATATAAGERREVAGLSDPDLMFASLVPAPPASQREKRAGLGGPPGPGGPPP